MKTEAKADSVHLYVKENGSAVFKKRMYMIQDCSACVENLLIAAHLLGLGACWLGVHPNAERVENIREFFHLPENIIPVSAVAVGWPSKNPPPRTNYNAEQVHLNAW